MHIVQTRAELRPEQRTHSVYIDLNRKKEISQNLSYPLIPMAIESLMSLCAMSFG